jgi:oligopeptide/dipeptide ABC transporter ATP-binding protein
VSGPALELDCVSVAYRTATGVASAVSDVSLQVAPGEIVGLVGESGCGKTTLSMAAMGLLPPQAEVSGEIRLDGAPITGIDAEARRRLRGDRIAIVVQDPLTSLDPTFSVGSQITEAIRAHRDVSRREARERAIELLGTVGIPDPERRFGDPPHRFSGGQRQRIVIAIALANDPAVLIADEPTTALDVTIQAQILALLLRLRREHGMAIVFITHDLGVVAQVCDRVGVMYAGQLVEALPSTARRPGELTVIGGEIPDLEQPPSGCRFAPRCPHRMPVCDTRPTLERAGADEGRVACWLYSEHADGVADAAGSAR